MNVTVAGASGGSSGRFVGAPGAIVTGTYLTPAPTVFTAVVGCAGSPAPSGGLGGGGGGGSVLWTSCSAPLAVAGDGGGAWPTPGVPASVTNNASAIGNGGVPPCNCTCNQATYGGKDGDNCWSWTYIGMPQGYEFTSQGPFLAASGSQGYCARPDAATGAPAGLSGGGAGGGYSGGSTMSLPKNGWQGGGGASYNTLSNGASVLSTSGLGDGYITLALTGVQASPPPPPIASPPPPTATLTPLAPLVIGANSCPSGVGAWHRWLARDVRGRQWVDDQAYQSSTVPAYPIVPWTASIAPDAAVDMESIYTPGVVSPTAGIYLGKRQLPTDFVFSLNFRFVNGPAAQVVNIISAVAHSPVSSNFQITLDTNSGTLYVAASGRVVRRKHSEHWRREPRVRPASAGSVRLERPFSRRQLADGLVRGVTQQLPSVGEHGSHELAR